MTEIGLEGANALAKRARDEGGKALTLCSTEWNVAGDCERPGGAVVTGSRYRGTYDWPEAGCTVSGGLVQRRPPPHTIHLTVRCRRCTRCRRLRRRIWSDRARRETGASVRTWFATLTASPEAQFHYMLRAGKRLRAQGIEFDALDVNEQFQERCNEMGVELQKFMKRLRKNTGASLRALWVFEAHKTGLPHIHGLIHEGTMVAARWADLDAQWKDGFSRFALLTDPAKSAYATKYLAKDALCRIRASRHYGAVNLEPPQEIASNALRDMSLRPRRPRF